MNGVTSNYGGDHARSCTPVSGQSPGVGLIHRSASCAQLGVRCRFGRLWLGDRHCPRTAARRRSGVRSRSTAAAASADVTSAAAGLTDRQMRDAHRQRTSCGRSCTACWWTRASRGRLATAVAALDLVRPPDAVIGRRTAAWLRGVDVRGLGATGPDGRRVHRADRAGRRCAVPASAATPHRSTGTWRTSTGVPCTTPVRTALDLLRYLPPHLGLGAADAMAHAGMFRVARPVRARGALGAAAATSTAPARLASYCEPRAESFGESWTRLRILDAGFPSPVPQVPLGHGWAHRVPARPRLSRPAAGHRVRRRRVPHRPRRPASRRGTPGPDPRRLRVDGRRRRARRDPRALAGLRACDGRAARAASPRSAERTW